MEGNNPSSYQPPKFCPQCGTPVNRQGAKFCTQCGRNFTKSGSDENIIDTGTPVSPVPSNAPTGPAGGSQSGMAPSIPPGQTQSTQEYSPGTRTSRTYNMITPNDIRGLNEPLLTKDDLIIAGIFSLVALGSHIFRYMLFFDAFPDLINLFVPLPFYAGSIVVILAIQKYLFHNQGVNIDYEADRFDYTRSLVISSFGLTLLPPRMKINQEKSMVPDEIYIPESGEYGMKYQPVPRSKYIGKIVRPKMHFFSTLGIALFSLFLVILYFRIDEPSIKIVFRLVAMYVSSFVVVELAPIYGRNNDLAGEYGRIRSFLIFLFGMILLLTTVLGERFFVALQNFQ